MLTPVAQTYTLTPKGGGAAVPINNLETLPQIDITNLQADRNPVGKPWKFKVQTTKKELADLTFGGPVYTNEAGDAIPATEAFKVIGTPSSEVRTLTVNYGGGLSVAVKIAFYKNNVIPAPGDGSEIGMFEAMASLADGEATAVVQTGY